MSLARKKVEVERLISAFEREASKFRDIGFQTFYITQEGPYTPRVFDQPNHVIMLWQYYGAINDGATVDQFITDLSGSDLKWGLRGSSCSFFGLIEGEGCQLFVRMAKRAGNLFDRKEAQDIKSRVVSEVIESEMATHASAKPVAAVNDNPLAVWLNYLLYHLSKTSPGRDRDGKIDPDPFSLSLLALERLAEDQEIGKTDRSTRNLSDLRFKVAVSFPGEKRRYVSRVVDVLRSVLGSDSVFYDFDYQAQLARPNLDTLLQRIYRDQSDLVVVFLCAEYAEKQWCGLEWRAVREIIKQKRDDQVMFVRFDDADVQGVLSIDGYIDGGRVTAKQVAELVVARVLSRSGGTS